MNPLDDVMKNLLASPKKPAAREAYAGPTTITGANLKEAKRGGSELTALLIAETETFDFPDGRQSFSHGDGPMSDADKIGALLYDKMGEIAKAMAAGRMANDEVSWQAARHLLSRYYALLSLSLTDEGRETIRAQAGLRPRNVLEEFDKATPAPDGEGEKAPSEAEVKQALDFGKYFGPSAN